MKGAPGKSKTGLALSKPLLATLYTPGNVYYRVKLYQKHLAFLGFGIKF